MHLFKLPFHLYGLIAVIYICLLAKASEFENNDIALHVHSYAYELPSVTKTRVVWVTKTTEVHAPHRTKDTEPHPLPRQLPFSLHSLVSSLFTYLFYLMWNVPYVVLYLPAKFIYLLFLERPARAILSIFLWILPILAFLIAITVAGIVIGGTFGWISATVFDNIWPSYQINSRQENKDADGVNLSSSNTIRKRRIT
ncbi:hypothetical protein BX667DRAFT_494841 [Coemansia mojavensis]|nr:hypothetical protein BX667DRAFT_494841 [Coemansia mojavensis]